VKDNVKELNHDKKVATIRSVAGLGGDQVITGEAGRQAEWPGRDLCLY
jgi:hypothetical protein